MGLLDNKAVEQKIEGNGNQQAAGNINNCWIPYPPTLPITLPAVLGKIVTILSQKPEPESVAPLSYEIIDKITHNNLVALRGWIDEYGNYGPIVDAIYATFDAQQPGAKVKILRQFRARYCEQKAEFQMAAGATVMPSIEVIRNHADEIMFNIYKQYRDEIRSLAASGIAAEDVEHCAIVLVCHAFINCKILERPDGQA